MVYHFNFNFVWRYADKLYWGLALSLEIALVSILIGMVIGLALALAYTGGNRLVRAGELRRVDRRGDSTVYRDAAALPGAQLAYLPQSHADLSKSEEALAHACAVMTPRDLGPPMGDDGGVGLMVPDCVTSGDAFEILVKDADDPAAVTCQIDRIEQRVERFVDADDFQIKHAMPRNLVKHVIQKTHTCGELALAAAVEIERNADLRFIGIACDLRLTCHDFRES